MVKFNELNTNKIKKTGNSKLYKNFLKLLMSAGLLSTSLAGCTPTDKPTDPVVVDPAEPTDPVVEKSQIEILAEEYEFFQWHLDDSTSKTVDGVTYDLAALKQQYGDLYRFVEPLSKEEVEYRFQYLAKYFADQEEKGVVEIYPGGIKTGNSDVSVGFNRIVKEQYESMVKKELGEEFNKFSKYYIYLEKTGNYYEYSPKSIQVLSELINTLNSIPFEDKDWFVRKYINNIDILARLYKEFNVEMISELTIPQKTK